MKTSAIAISVVFCCTASMLVAAGDDPYKKLNKEARMEAVRRAQVWSGADVASRDIRSGPDMRGAFSPGSTVTCDYVEKDSGGKTPKFWCKLANGDEVKVKYGQENGEVYGEVAATRLLWALGFGADGMYPAKVVCRGCPADPWAAQSKKGDSEGSTKVKGSNTFDPAVIERPASGDVIESGKDSGWAWVDLNSVDQTRGGAPVAQRDALKLLAVFMQHTDTKPEQQRVVCLDRAKGLAVQKDGRCANPFMMLGDLGKTFGRANMFNKDNPGAVNLKAWADAGIWRSEGKCVGDMDQSYTGTLDRPVISEDGRKFLADLLGRLSDQQIRDLFEVAQFTRRDSSSSVDDWVRVFKTKRDEIANARCSNPAL